MCSTEPVAVMCITVDELQPFERHFHTNSIDTGCVLQWLPIQYLRSFAGLIGILYNARNTYV